MDILLGLLALWLLTIGITVTVARGKGLSTGLWAVLGILFGVFALVAVLFAEPTTESRVALFRYDDSGESLEILRRAQSGILFARLRGRQGEGDSDPDLSSADESGTNEIRLALTVEEANQVEAWGQDLPVELAEEIADRLREKKHEQASRPRGRRASRRRYY